jgi:hypothetical protein
MRSRILSAQIERIGRIWPYQSRQVKRHNVKAFYPFFVTAAGEIINPLA